MPEAVSANPKGQQASTEAVVTALCGILDRGNDVQRCFAAQALGRIGDPAAVDALMASLLDEDEDVRVEAAQALGLIGDERAGAALLGNLVGDPCGDVKVNAAIALGQLRESEAIPLLRKLVRGRDESVVWDDTEIFAGGWDDWLDVQIKAIETLAELGAAEAVPDILAAMNDELGQELSGPAVKALARLGERGIQALGACLEATDERMRRCAAESLAGIDSGLARAVLAHGLGDAASEVRLAAVRALAAHDPGDLRLASLFDDADARVRAEVVRLCGSHHPGRLERTLDDPNDMVQKAVIGVLTSAADIPRPQDLIYRLRVKIRGPSEDVAVAASSALAVLAPDVALHDLVEQLRDQSCPTAVRCAAARALAKLGMEEAVRALQTSVEDNERQVRLEAMVALAQIAIADKGSDSARGVLIAALRGELVPVRADEPPAQGLERQADSTSATSDKDSGASQSPSPAITDGESSCEQALAIETRWPTSTLKAILERDAEAMSAEGEEQNVLAPEDLEFLELAQSKPWKKHVPVSPPVAVQEDVRRFAARVLGDVADEAVIRALAAALDDQDRDLRRTAADSLARLADKMGSLPADIAPALITVLADRDRDVRVGAVRALGRSGNQAAVSALARMLKDDDAIVRAEAARMMAKFDAVGPEVIELLADDDPAVRLAAAEAVASQGGPVALAQLTEFAVAFNGFHCKDAARLLREVDASAASGHFVSVLTDRDQQQGWRIAIEILGELNRSHTSTALGR